MPVRLPKTRGMRRREAAAWLARLQSGHEPDVAARHERWLEAHPENPIAFDRVRTSYERAGLLRHSSFAQQNDGHAPPAKRTLPRYAAAAAVATVLLLPAVLIVKKIVQPPVSIGAVMLTTGVGEIRRVELSDGSRVTLDTSSGVEVDTGQRRAVLRKGRARFDIRRGSSPFLVKAGTSQIAADQAVIDVERSQNLTRVEVVAGTVAVSGNRGTEGRLGLHEGEAVNISTASPAQREPASGGDWTNGKLEFRSTAVDVAVARANAYSTRKIELRGNIGALRVTGVFRAGDTAGLARALAAAFGLSIEERPGGGWILSSKPRPSRQTKNGG